MVSLEVTSSTKMFLMTGASVVRTSRVIEGRAEPPLITPFVNVGAISSKQMLTDPHFSELELSSRKEV